MMQRLKTRIRLQSIVVPALMAAMVAPAALGLVSTGNLLMQDDAEKPAEEPKVAYVHMKTTMGDIVLELNAEKAPISTKNFLTYTEEKFYDGTIFHRVMPNFMIQGGGFDKDMKQKETHDPIKNEWQNGLKNERGTIAMARLGRQPDSATCQFFINVVDNAGLDQPRDGAGYAVFGKVVAGMPVVDKIKTVATTSVGNHQNVPVEPIIIETARKIDEAKAKEMIEAEKKAGEPGSGSD